MAKKKSSVEKLNHRIIIGDSRNMKAVESGSVSLAVTSPPKWEPERKGSSADIGSSNTADRYFAGLLMVWKETLRTLQSGCRLCVHIPYDFMMKCGDVGARKVPIYNGIVNSCLVAGFEHDSVIVWNREPKRNLVFDKSAITPREIEIFPCADFILIFKKPGEQAAMSEGVAKTSRLAKKDASRLSMGIWTFPDTEPAEEPWSYPVELPRRLIRLFSFTGEVVLDPFLGNGATSVAARDMGRLSIGFEIDSSREEKIRQNLTSGKPVKSVSFEAQPKDDHRRSERKISDAKKKLFKGPNEEQAEPEAAPKEEPKQETPVERLTVTNIININHLRMSSGKDLKLLGIEIPTEFYSRNPGLYRWAFDFLRRELGSDPLDIVRAKKGGDSHSVYISLGKETLNENLIRAGLALSDKNCDHDLRKKFDYLEKQAKENDMGMWALKKTDSPR